MGVVALGRTVAVGVGVAAVVAGWLSAAYEPGRGSSIGLVVRLLPSMAMLVASLWLAVAQLRGPSHTVAFALAPGSRAFRTRLPPAAIWWPAVLVVALTAHTTSLAASMGGDPAWQLTVVDVTVGIVVGVALIGVLGSLLVALWSGLPAVELSPTGVRAMSMFGYVAVPWDALRPGHPRPPGLRDTTLPLAIDRSDLARRRGLGMILLRWLDVHPWFLADAIRYYTAHPEHRAAIGTAEEHDRLRGLLSAGRA